MTTHKRSRHEPTKNSSVRLVVRNRSRTQARIEARAAELASRTEPGTLGHALANPRETRFVLRLSDEDEKALTALEKRWPGMNRSAIVRRLLRIATAAPASREPGWLERVLFGPAL